MPLGMYPRLIAARDVIGEPRKRIDPRFVLLGFCRAEPLTTARATLPNLNGTIGDLDPVDSSFGVGA